MKQRTILYLILANIFWAGNYVFGKFVVQELPPIQITLIRWCIAILFLFPIAHFIERPKWKAIWKSWKVIVAMSLLGVIGYNILLYQALQYTSALNAALVNALNPGTIVVFSVILLGERLTKLNIIGFAVSLIGVLLILTHGHLTQILKVDYNLGDLLMVGAILVWTFYSILGRKTTDIPPISATTISVLIGIIIMLPFSLYQWVPMDHLSSKATIGILYMGLFPTVGSFVLWNLGVRQIGPSRSGIFLNLITVFTAIISIILGEQITAIQIVGGLLVFVGVFLTSKKDQRKDAGQQGKEIAITQVN
jgi:drug/metabolite transporter (DMT)-like permease